MQEVVIAAAYRTPIGKLGGAFHSLTHHGLGETMVRGLLSKTGLDPSLIDEVVFGCVGQQTDAPNVARVIALRAGLPNRVPAFTVARNCASGLQAVISACQMIHAGDARRILAGGVEVMSSSPFVNRDLRFGKRLKNSLMIDSLWEGLTDPVSGMVMGETAEVLAAEFKITREEQDAFALLSHAKAVKAVTNGVFRDEIVEVPVLRKNARRQSMTAMICDDEGPNPEINPQAMSGCEPAFKEKGTVTAANSCPISDGAAAVFVTTAGEAKSLGLEILAKIRGYGIIALEPERMGLGPVDAVHLTLKKTGLNLKDIELVELNEAFAAQYLACERLLKLDRQRTNVNGGAIALGHPVGATGVRLVATLLHEMKRRRISLGLVAMCVGGGQGAAMVFERS